MPNESGIAMFFGLNDRPPIVTAAFSALPSGIVNIIQFPVSSGAFVAMILEVLIPKSNS